MTQDNVAPAYLFAGPPEQTQEKAFSFVQSMICPARGCTHCATCVQIAHKQHESIIWIEPEKRYSLSDLAQIFTATAFTLDTGHHRFFVITKADILTETCANSLLKLVEEPPAGYHFLFLAQRQSLVLPTIRSRCLQQSLYATSSHTQAPVLIEHFMRLRSDPIALSKEIANCSMTEQECMVFVDQLLEYWISAYKKALTHRSQEQSAAALHMIQLLTESIATPPAMGSAKLFWKNLALQRERKEERERTRSW